MRTGKSKWLFAIVSLLSLVSGCQVLPVAASCPPPPPVPLAIAEYASPPKSLIEDSAQLLLDFGSDLFQMLKKASGQPM